MKHIIATISNTFSTFKFMMNPEIMKTVQTMKEEKQVTTFSKKDVLYHKHYMIQIIN
ncbi:MAG: hypothetical protein ACMG6E_05235 [Candidatus Roizmanbacteria bacterium]